MGQAQHGHPGFSALTCDHMMQYQRGRRCKLFGKAGERPVSHLPSARTVCTLRVTFLGSGAQSHLKLDFCVGPIANKNYEGKMQMILNREFKVLEIAGREVSRTSFACEIGAWRWHSSHRLRRC